MNDIADDMLTWLGPAAEDMTDEQIERFTRVWDHIEQRYPDPDDQDERDAALSAAVQYLLGDTTTTQAGDELLRARQRAAEALAAARQVAVMAVEDGRPEATTAREIGVDRMALRGWLGKR